MFYIVKRVFVFFFFCSTLIHLHKESRWVASRADAPDLFESDQSPVRTGHKMGGIRAIGVGNVTGSHPGCLCRSLDDLRSVLPLNPGQISQFMLVHGCLAPGWEEGSVPRLFQKGRGPGQLVSQHHRGKLRGPTLVGHGLFCPEEVESYSFLNCCLYII